MRILDEFYDKHHPEFVPLRTQVSFMSTTQFPLYNMEHFTTQSYELPRREGAVN